MRVTRLSPLLLTTLGLAGSALANDLVRLESREIRALRSSATVESTSDVRVASRPKHLTDGVDYTSWIGGADASIEVEFGATRYLAAVSLIAGCVGSNRTYAEFGRPVEIAVETDERRIVLAVGESRGLQQLRMDPPLAARGVTVRVLRAQPGRQAGVCISELVFQEGDAVSSMDEAARERLDAAVAEFDSPAGGDAPLDAVVQLGPGAVPRLISVLESGSTLAASRAVRALRRIGSPAAAEALFTYWPKAPAELKAETLSALARCSDERVLPILASTLESKDLALADAAAESLSHFGVAALPALGRALESRHEDVQLRALRALRRVRDPRALALAAPFIRGRHSTVRAAAARALAATGTIEAIQYLEPLATDPHPTVRVAVARALVQFPGVDATRLLGQLMRDTDGLVARVAINRMARHPEGERQLAIYFGEADALHGELAVARLGALRTPGALRVVVDALRRGETRYRQALREAVIGFGAVGVSLVAESALTDTRLRVDAEAILADADPAGIAAAVELLRNHLSAAPGFLVRGIGRRAFPAALPALDEVWATGTLTARVDVLKGWAAYPAPLVGERIIRALASEDPAIRAEAATAAGLAKVDAAIPTLLTALTDQTIATERVIDALSRLGDELADEFMVTAFFDRGTTMEVRLAILHACRRTESLQCIGLIARAGGHPNPDIRAEALRLIARR